MNRLSFLKRSLGPVVASLVLASSLSQAARPVQPPSATTIQQLADGPPHLTKNLGEETFVPFEVEGLANATVGYLDYNWFRERGVRIPPEGLKSTELVQDVLKAFAWMTRKPNDPAEAFNGAKRTLYAYYYGGYGLGSNIGSGRSASFSGFDVKGLPTPLIRSKHAYHSNGAVQSIEAVDEAIWSRVLDGETKYGSNRVVAVIFTGMLGNIPGEDRNFPRALIVREMAVRPAHHMLSLSREEAADRTRVARTMDSLLENLPYPNEQRPKSDRQAIKEGVLELARREAITQAELFAKRIYFGSNSPSNLEITGRRLDLGDHTALEGYTKIYRIEDDSPFGETSEFKLVQEAFRKSLLEMAPANLRYFIPTETEVARVFDQTFENQRAIEMVKLAGAPPELIEKMKDDPVLKKAGDVIAKVAMAGNENRVFMEHAGWPNTSTFNLQKILSLLAAAPLESAEKIEAALGTEMSKDASLRAELAKAYMALRNGLEKQAASEGISAEALSQYVREAAKIRNRNRPSLVRGDTRWKKLWAITDQALHGHDGTITQQYIEEQIALGRFNFKDAAPYQLVVKENEKAAEGWALRRVFDLKRGVHSTIVRINVANGEAYFKGRKVTPDELLRSVIEYARDDGRVVQAEATRAGDFVEFAFHGQPSVALERIKLSTKVVPLRSAQSSDGKSSGSSTIRSRARVGTCEAAFGG